MTVLTFIGPLFITLVVGCMFLCMVQAFVEYIRLNREPVLDELDYDNGHPDGFVRHYATITNPRGHSSQGS